ncbi:MAG: DUF420 domain-containing protein [Phycisphaerae bacterium]|nr:DUF420 domain-containing protein [Phycisphaerae bacterium]
MLEISDLPAVNATLNALALIFLIIGHAMIRRRNIGAHRACMIAAFSISVLFLVSYLTYRIAGAEKRFGGIGWIRPVYFFILFSHVILAASVPVLAGRTLYLALRGRFDAHRRIARWTYPIWVYVSITGVVVYILLFQIYGPSGQ